MSRSRKKNAVYTDYGRNSTWYAKRQASKVVRRFKGEIQNGNSYKKIYCSYNIHDWKIFYTKSEIGIGYGDGSYGHLTQDEFNKVLRK